MSGSSGIRQYTPSSGEFPWFHRPETQAEDSAAVQEYLFLKLPVELAFCYPARLCIPVGFDGEDREQMAGLLVPHSSKHIQKALNWSFDNDLSPNCPVK
jgi:hypothetical protein